MLKDWKNLPNEKNHKLLKNIKEIMLDTHRHLKARASGEMSFVFS